MIMDFKKRFRFLTVAWITLMWCMLYGEVSWANVLGGFAIGLLIVLAFPLPALPVSGITIRFGSLLSLIAYFFWDLVISSFRVSWLALRRADQPPSAIVRVPMRVQEDFIFALAVSLLNLTPGGSVMDLDISNRMLTMHILDARSTSILQRSLDSIAELEKRLITTFEKGA